MTTTKRSMTLTTKDGNEYAVTLTASEEAYWRPIWEKAGHKLGLGEQK